MTEDPEVSGPPPRNPQLLSEVIKQVELMDIQLVACQFVTPGVDDAVLPSKEVPDGIEVSIGVDYSYDPGEQTLGCLIDFSSFIPGEDPPQYLMAGRWRIAYSVEDDEGLGDDHWLQFANWNALFQVWPYYRQLADSMNTRARLDVPLVPVFKMPGLSTRE